MGKKYPFNIKYNNDPPFNSVIFGYESESKISYINNKNKLRSLLLKLYLKNIDFFKDGKKNKLIIQNLLAAFVSYIIKSKIFVFLRFDQKKTNLYYNIDDVQIYHDIYMTLFEYHTYYVTEEKK